MKLIKLLFFIIFFNGIIRIYSQKCNSDIWLENYTAELNRELIDSNNLEELDFGSLLLKNKTNYLGFIGRNKKRLHVFFKSIKKIDNNNYHVLGNTIVGGNNRNFEGELVLTQICSFKNFIYGVDDWMKEKIKDQGIVIANLNLSENAKYNATGIFNGILLIRWYIDLDDHLNYDDIDSDSDSYSNNQFLGKWTSFKTKKTSQCAWGHYKIPCAGDLNIGSAEFNPNEKYYDFGWKDYSNKQKLPKDE